MLIFLGSNNLEGVNVTETEGDRARMDVSMLVCVMVTVIDSKSNICKLWKNDTHTNTYIHTKSV